MKIKKKDLEDIKRRSCCLYERLECDLSTFDSIKSKNKKIADAESALQNYSNKLLSLNAWAVQKLEKTKKDLNNE